MDTPYRLLSGQFLAVSAFALSPVPAHADVLVFNGSELAHTAFSAAAVPDALAPLGDNDTTWLALAEPAAEPPVAPVASALAHPAIALTALGLVIFSTRRKLKVDDGRQSLWGALGNSPPVAGM